MTLNIERGFQLSVERFRVHLGFAYATLRD